MIKELFASIKKWFVKSFVKGVFAVMKYKRDDNKADHVRAGKEPFEKKGRRTQAKGKD